MTEFEFDSPVARLLDRYTWPPERRPDWQDVVRRAGHGDRMRRRRALVLAAAVAGLVTLAFATPLGGAIRRSVSDFSDWLSGTPGAPVSAEEQRAFDESNEKSWNRFPGSPRLRRLGLAEADAVAYDLLGFRSGDGLCIRIVASGAAAGSTVRCAPVGELQHDDGPVRVLVADWPVGRGDKTATIGFDTYHSARAQVTAGIAADGVDTIELIDEQGPHEVPVQSNAFMYVAERPDVEQRVTHIRARLEDGRIVSVPFTVAPHGPAPELGAATGEPGGPTAVERSVTGGTIGWFGRREERGEPIGDELKDRFGTLAEAEFGRLITPDPGSAKRIAITLGTEFRFPLRAKGRPAIWYTVLSGGTAGGSAMPLAEMFGYGPFTFSYGSTGVGAQFATFAGLASDDVARMELYTGTGNRIPVPLRDNAYLVELALARFPAKLVAYDAQGRVIGIQSTRRGEEPATVVGPPILRLTATAAGATLELQANRTKEGGECWFVKGTGKASIRADSCTPKNWTEGPLRIGTLGEPPLLLYGRARPDIVRVELHYRDGAKQAFTPERGGYILAAIPPRDESASTPLEIVGLDANGKIVSRQKFHTRPSAGG